MTTKAQIVARLKNDYPTLRTGDDERGYTELLAKEYEETISQWADNELTAEIEKTKAEADKAAILAKIGLTAEEAKLLLS
jgi:hypothetical protein